MLSCIFFKVYGPGSSSNTTMALCDCVSAGTLFVTLLFMEARPYYMNFVRGSYLFILIRVLCLFCMQV